MVLAPRYIVKKIEPFIVVLSLLIIWEMVSALNLVNPLILPEPSKILKSLYNMLFTPVGGATLIVHVWASLEKFFIGFLVAAFLGSFLGIWMGWSQRVNSVFAPFFEIIRFIPPVAWISFAILWFGMGLAAQSYIIGIGAFIPALENSRQTIKLIDPIYIQVARVFGASDRTIFWKVLLPAGLPLLIAGVRIGMGIGWMCLVAAEMISRPTLLGGEGLGYLIETSRMTLRSDYIIGGMLLIGVIGYCLDVAIRCLEKVLCPWRR
jgi:ABC-type nitrate/sulfonate/bicarbonate transport system permease component